MRLPTLVSVAAMTWLVTGGAGYIGAHVLAAFRSAGRAVVALDDLSTGQADRVGPSPLVVGSVLDTDLVATTLTEHRVTGVVHIAAKKQVGESTVDPLHYWEQNVTGLQALLSACRTAGVEQVVFSSSAATYGLPDVDLVTEDTPGVPLSPYGETKLVGEWLLRSAGPAYGLRHHALRYFNVAGCAAPELGDTGVFNLVPMVFERLEAGLRPRVFGADYPTPDGTCVRDYVHVADIAQAHLASAAALEAGAASRTYNLGRGVGSSVLEVLQVIGEVTGRDVTPEVVARRPGDPARIVASAALAQAELGVTCRRDLTDMVASAWTAWRAARDA